MRWSGIGGVEFGREEIAASTGEVPPGANRRFVIGHQGVLESIEAILEGAECLEHWPAIIAEDGRPEVGVGRRDAGAVTIGTSGQGQPFRGHRGGQCRSNCVRKWLVYARISSCSDG